MQQCLQTFAEVDVLINCAAAYERGELLQIKPETFAWMQKINVEIPLRLMQIFARKLIACNKPGSIVNISSIAGFRPITGSSLNSCSKAGLNMLTQCAALELGPYGIRVNGIAPGQTETESNQPYMQQDPEGWMRVINKIPLRRAGKPIDIGELAVFLASEQASWLTGVTIPVDGGMIISWQ